jgi:tetratricopeptide (TPR) repeat protein
LIFVHYTAWAGCLEGLHHKRLSPIKKMENSSLITELQSYFKLAADGFVDGEPAFHQILKLYLDSALWGELNPSAKDLLVKAFLCWGEWQLCMQPLTSPPDSFVAAINLSPEDPFVFMRQVSSYLKYSENPSLWSLGVDLIQKALVLSPNDCLAWRLLGQVYERIGVKTADLANLELATTTFSMALSLSVPSSVECRVITWEQGKTYYETGRLSGEAADYHRAIELYRKVQELGELAPIFFIDFGHACDALGALINAPELLLEALSYYELAAKGDPNFFEAHLQLACHAQHLFEVLNDDQYYYLALAAFNHSCALYPNDSLVWCKLAMLSAIYAKRSGSEAELTKSFSCFAHAHSLEPRNSIILTRWAEVLLACGAESENYEWLREAEQKMRLAVQVSPEQIEVWAMHGHSLNELGNYFSEPIYHRRAVEAFQYALALEPSNPRLLHGLALSYLALACLLGDVSMLESVVLIFERGMECDPDPLPDFLIDWGVALMRLGEISMARSYAQDAVEKFELAIKLYTEDTRTAPAPPPIDWLYNYGCALDFLGDFDEEPHYYEQAIQVLNCVVDADPSFTNARYNLAMALSHLAELTGDLDCFELASEQFRLLLQEDPEDSQGWEEWGGMLLQQALLMQEPARPSCSQELFKAAEQRLCQAISLGSSSAFYTVACLYSLQGNYEAGMHYIIRAADSQALPPLDDLMHDEWLEGLRSLPHFRRMLLEIATKTGRQ